MFCDCFFCDGLFKLNEKVGLPCRNSIVYEDENVFITPDIAPVVLGHFLIISKKHVKSFGCSDDGTYNSLELAKGFLHRSVFNGNKTIFFEHGSVIGGTSTAGVCIDHAHLHVIPFIEGFDIDSIIKENLFEKVDKELANREVLKDCAVTKQPYLFFEVSGEGQWYYPVYQLPSQFFRLVISNHFKTYYNWRRLFDKEESKALFMETLELATHPGVFLKRDHY